MVLLLGNVDEQRGAKKAMSSSSSSAVIIVVTQCQELWGDDDTRKIRLNGLSSSFTGPQLQRALLHKIQDETTTKEGHPEWLPQEEFLVEIYDGERDKFVSLFDFDSSEDLAPKFGRFLRCNIFVASRNQHDTSNKEEPPLAIMGRFFPFDPKEPMAYCGTQIVIQEHANNLQEDGTGLVVCE